MTPPQHRIFCCRHDQSLNVLFRCPWPDCSLLLTFNSLKTLLYTLGPLFLPKLITSYRTLRAQSTTSPLPVQPLPKPVQNSLNLLFAFAVCALISTLPYFSPENIFDITSSRLQTPNDVLFTRLTAVRGSDGLSIDDNNLRPKLASIDSRLLYLTFGPDVVTNCPFCLSDEPRTYFFYALPSILLPHIIHLFALGLATSNLVAGKWGSKWRATASVIGLGLAFGEAYSFTSYDWRANARAPRPEEYVLFYWRMRVLRGILISVIDAVVAGLLYLNSTNRMFVTPLSVAERMEAALKLLEQAKGKMHTIGIIRNAVARDDWLRRRTDTYWIKEGRLMGEVMTEREVVEGVRNALENRVQVSKVEDDARRFSEGITAWPAQLAQASE